MAKAPKKPEEIFSDFVKDYEEIYGDGLISVILYGSGATEDYIPGRSDLNFLIVLTEEGIKELHRAFKVVAKWHKRRVATPLFITEEYIATSLDVFPLEFLNIQRHYRVVWGQDVLAGTNIDRKQLRLQCEREVKGKLLQLRKTYLSSERRKRDVIAIISQSLTAFISIFHGLLYLRDLEIPDGRKEVIVKTATETGLTEGPLLQLLQVKEGRTKLSSNQMQALMERYIEEVRQLASWVDRLQH